MRCFKCATELPVRDILPFKAFCPTCAAYLHSCKACAFYNPKVSQQCEQPYADFVGDKNGPNFCESHQIATRGNSEVAAALVPGENARRAFEDLFA